MPGFLIGIDTTEQGVAPPAKPIYSYTWSFDQLQGLVIGETSPLIYIKDLTLPEYGTDIEEGPGASLKYKYAKSVNWNDIKLTFYASMGLIMALEEQKRKIWSPETGIRPAAFYKFDSVITQYLADDVEVANVWTLHGSWLKGLSHSNLTYTNSDVHNVVATVAYDWATVE